MQMLLAGAQIGGTLLAGQQQNAMYKAQAQQNEFAARTEELKGRDQADKIRRSLQATLASQNAAFAARGISLSSGTPKNIAAESKINASADIQNAMFGAGMGAAAERGTAAQNRMAGKAAVTASYTKAAGQTYSLISGGGF